MDKPTEGLLILGFISVIAAIGWHSVVKRYGYAILGATATAVILFQIAVYIDLGFLDPFFIIAIIISGIAALVVAAIIGIPFKVLRGKRRRKAMGTNTDIGV